MVPGDLRRRPWGPVTLQSMSRLSPLRRAEANPFFHVILKRYERASTPARFGCILTHQITLRTRCFLAF